MKKNLLKVAFVAAIALVSGINAFNAQKSENLSDVVLANVEALADDESTGSIYCPYEGLGCIIKYTNGTMETIPNKWAHERN